MRGQNSWFSIDLMDIQIKLTHYTLRQDKNHGYYLRSWQFAGSNDHQLWELLMEHKSDKSLNDAYATKTWRIDNCNNYCRYFRIKITGKDSNNGWYLMCVALEIYGHMTAQKSKTSNNTLRIVKVV